MSRVMFCTKIHIHTVEQKPGPRCVRLLFPDLDERNLKLSWADVERFVNPRETFLASF